MKVSGELFVLCAVSADRQVSSQHKTKRLLVWVVLL